MLDILHIAMKVITPIAAGMKEQMLNATQVGRK